MRDFSANMALKLKRQFSEMSPTKMKRVFSVDKDDEFFKESKISVSDDKIINETDSESLFDNYCSICYVNEIVVNGEDHFDEQTFEFSCKHRFCRPCCEQMLRPHIINNALQKLKCPESSCMKTVCEEDIARLFAQEPNVLDKLTLWRSRATEISNHLLRYCTKPRCDGKIIAANDQVKFVICDRCNTRICFNCRDTWHGSLTC